MQVIRLSVDVSFRGVLIASPSQIDHDGDTHAELLLAAIGDRHRFVVRLSRPGAAVN